MVVESSQMWLKHILYSFCPRSVPDEGISHSDPLPVPDVVHPGSPSHCHTPPRVQEVGIPADSEGSLAVSEGRVALSKGVCLADYQLLPQTLGMEVLWMSAACEKHFYIQCHVFCTTSFAAQRSLGQSWRFYPELLTATLMQGYTFICTATSVHRGT